VNIESSPCLIQFLLDDVDLSCEFNGPAGHALALVKQFAILLDPVVADRLQKFALPALHEFQ